MPYPITNVQRHVVLMKYFRFYAPAIKKKKKKKHCARVQGMRMASAESYHNHHNHSLFVRLRIK